MTDRDIFLITVDCWRFDAPSRMENFTELTSDWEHGDCLCAGPKTANVFPAILASKYFPQAYTSEMELNQDVKTLPEILSENGYTTGAFIGGNPWLEKWRSEFGSFWNADIYTHRQKSTFRQGIEYGWQLLNLEQRFPASLVAEKAVTWYNQSSSPSFVWLHFMDPHSPFHPGVRRALRIGLLRSYYSLIEYKRQTPRTPETMSSTTRNQLEALYWECIDYFDTQLDSIFNHIPSDATVITLGDHGQEFSHGMIHHERLYDECIKVPIAVQWQLDGDFTLQNSTRQIDIAPTILDGLECDTPNDWEGTPHLEGEERTTFSFSRAYPLNRRYASIRTQQYKLIHTYDFSGEDVIEKELYDLSSDPKEEQNIIHNESATTLESKLVDNVARISIMEDDSSNEKSVSSSVESRLKELGYK